MDLIDRQAAIDAMNKLDVSDGVGISSIACALQKEAVRSIEELPSAEPEVVRCKDCKHFHYDKPYVIQGIPVLGHEVCDFWGGGCWTSENGFCSYAERRTDA